ncbi:hypothetical protein HKX48_005390 [Thoreauomyces humboldtii]|nr:hypothetical protein HKX48_005390 [Thoreauomyces humboldtii]
MSSFDNTTTTPHAVDVRSAEEPRLADQGLHTTHQNASGLTYNGEEHLAGANETPVVHPYDHHNDQHHRGVTHPELAGTFVDPITIERLNMDEKHRPTNDVVDDNGHGGFEGVEEYDAEAIRARQEAKPIVGKRSTRTLAIQGTLWLLFTGYTIALWALGHDSAGKRKDGFAFWTVIWVFVTLRFIAQHVCISKIFWNPLGHAWTSTIGRATASIARHILWGTLLLVVLACMLLTALFSDSANSSRGERVQSWAGVCFMLLFTFGFSRNRRAINLQTVAVGVLLQFVFALLVLRWETGTDIMAWFSAFVDRFLSYSHTGLEFLIGTTPYGTFAVGVLPAIIFFCSVISVVYYWGGMQYLVQTLGKCMMVMMDTSGAESIVAAASPFVGQVENALLVLPFIEYMTRSELHAVMLCGFATISGSVLAGYVSIIGDARLILTACIMSIPAALVITKIRYPEEEESLTKGSVRVPAQKDQAVNFLHAAGNGAATGIQLVIIITAALLALISLYNAANDLCGWLFDMLNIHRPIVDTTLPHPDWVTIQFILSYPFFIFAWFIGVNGNEARQAGEILAGKMVVNEFYAYTALGALRNPQVPDPTDATGKKMIPLVDASGNVVHNCSFRTFQLMAFALCGFANIGSVGIQVSALGALSPNRKKDLAQLAVSSMFFGSIATFMTACVAGILI